MECPERPHTCVLESSPHICFLKSEGFAELEAQILKIRLSCLSSARKRNIPKNSLEWTTLT